VDARAMKLEERRREARQALARYQHDPFYVRLGLAVSWAVVAGQGLLVALTLRDTLGWGLAALALALSWLAADLLGGVVHLLMDHRDTYTGRLGPLTAAFHQHHQKLRYEEKPLPLVYFHESGFKLWLPPFLALGVLLELAGALDPFALRVWAWTGVLSSVAEVSHYLVHGRRRRWAEALATAGLLLSRRRHARHHREDNVGYAFLNGWSDPLLDRVARCGFPGYKAGTDLHFQEETEIGTPGVPPPS